MNCRETHLLLQIYLDNEMSPVDARIVEDHLRVCEDCCGEVDAYRRIDALLSDDVARSDVETGPFGDCMRREFKAPKHRSLSIWTRVAAAVALVLTPLSIWIVYNRGTMLVYHQAVNEHLRAEMTGAGAIAGGEDLDRLVARFTAGRVPREALASLRVLGGHPCHMGDVRCAHLVYSTSDGHVVSVYVYREDDATDGGAPRVTALDGELVADAHSNGVRSIVVGDADSRDDIMRAVEAFR